MHKCWQQTIVMHSCLRLRMWQVCADSRGNCQQLSVFVCVCSVFDHKTRAALRFYPLCCCVCRAFGLPPPHCVLLLLLLLYSSPVDSRLLCASQLSQNLPQRQLSASCMYACMCVHRQLHASAYTSFRSPPTTQPYNPVFCAHPCSRHSMRQQTPIIHFYLFNSNSKCLQRVFRQP